MKINEKALSTGKSSFLPVIVALVQVRSGLCGITMPQFFRSTGEHDCLWFKQRLSWSGWSWILKARANARNNTQHCWANIVVSSCAMLADVCKRSQQVTTCWIFRWEYKGLCLCFPDLSAKLSTQTSNLRLYFSNVNVQNVSRLFENLFAFVSHLLVRFVHIPQAISFLKKIDQLIDFRLRPASSSSSVFSVTSRFLSAFGCC